MQIQRQGADLFTESYLLTGIVVAPNTHTVRI